LVRDTPCATPKTHSECVLVRATKLTRLDKTHY
jgi:hypothetical protein